MMAAIQQDITNNLDDEELVAKFAAKGRRILLG